MVEIQCTTKDFTGVVEAESVERAAIPGDLLEGAVVVMPCSRVETVVLAAEAEGPAAQQVDWGAVVWVVTAVRAGERQVIPAVAAEAGLVSAAQYSTMEATAP
jgi:hypothetical protein